MCTPVTWWRWRSTASIVSALVLLASGDTVILDACDGRTPFVVRPMDLLGAPIYAGLD